MKNKPISIVETELTPVNTSRKSFYRKAFVLDDLRGTRYLKSFDSIMCSVNDAGEVQKYEEILSTTTRRHVKSFLYAFAPNCSSKDFDTLEFTKTRPKLMVIH